MVLKAKKIQGESDDPKVRHIVLSDTVHFQPPYNSGNLSSALWNDPKYHSGVRGGEGGG